MKKIIKWFKEPTPPWMMVLTFATLIICFAFAVSNMLNSVSEVADEVEEKGLKHILQDIWEGTGESSNKD